MPVVNGDKSRDVTYFLPAGRMIACRLVPYMACAGGASPESDVGDALMRRCDSADCVADGVVNGGAAWALLSDGN